MTYHLLDVWSKPEVNKFWPMNQIQATSCFYKVYGNIAMLICVCLHYKDGIEALQQRWRSPAKAKIFPTWPFAEKVCQPLVWGRHCSLHAIHHLILTTSLGNVLSFFHIWWNRGLKMFSVLHRDTQQCGRVWMWIHVISYVEPALFIRVQFLCPWAPERWPIILVNSKTLEPDPLNLNNLRQHVT